MEQLDAKLPVSLKAFVKEAREGLRKYLQINESTYSMVEAQVVKSETDTRTSDQKVAMLGPGSEDRCYRVNVQDVVRYGEVTSSDLSTDHYFAALRLDSSAFTAKATDAVKSLPITAVHVNLSSFDEVSVLDFQNLLEVAGACGESGNVGLDQVVLKVICCVVNCLCLFICFSCTSNC